MRKYALIHGSWIIFILAGLLVGAISVEWASIKELATIISFAVGLASLILAVIAIFQSMTTAPALTGALSNMTGIANEITNVTKDLQTTATALVDRTAAVAGVPETLGQMQQQLSSIAVVTANLTTPSGTAKDKTKDGNVTEKFLNRSTNGLVLGLYLSVRAKETGKVNDSSKIFAGSAVFVSAVNAVISTMRAAELMNITQTEATFRVDGLGEFDPESIKDRYIKSKDSKVGVTKKFFVDADLFVEPYFLDQDESKVEPVLHTET